MLGIDTRTFQSFRSFVRIDQDPYGTIWAMKCSLAWRRHSGRVSPAIADAETQNLPVSDEVIAHVDTMLRAIVGAEAGAPGDG